MSLQVTSARSSEVTGVASYREAGAFEPMSRILNQPLAAEFEHWAATMSYEKRIRDFLNLGGERRAGRWYGVLLAVGLLVLGYAIIYDWPSSSISERVKRMVTLAMMGVLTVIYLRRPGRVPHVRSNEPPP